MINIDAVVTGDQCPYCGRYISRRVIPLDDYRCETEKEIQKWEKEHAKYIASKQKILDFILEAWEPPVFRGYESYFRPHIFRNLRLQRKGSRKPV